MKMTKAHVPLERDIERYFVKEVEAHGWGNRHLHSISATARLNGGETEWS